MNQQTSTPCRFGYEEYDGSRFCHEHTGFLHGGEPQRICDRHPLRTGLKPPG